MKLFFCTDFIHQVIIDEEDWERVKKYNWVYDKGTKRIKRSGREPVWLSRFIMNATDSMIEIDHINRNLLDNRKENLRFATKSQNAANSGPRRGKKYKGTYYSIRQGKWVAMIMVRGKTLCLGCFDNEVAAAKQYDKYAKKHFKEFAYLNFPNNQE